MTQRARYALQIYVINIYNLTSFWSVKKLPKTVRRRFFVKKFTSNLKQMPSNYWFPVF